MDRDLMRPSPGRRAADVLAIGALCTLAACSVSTTTTESREQSGLREAPANLLHDRGAASRAIAAIARQVGAVPARARRVLIYPEYLDAEAQDPTIPEHLDEYEWRGGEVSGPDPVHLSGPQEAVEAALFPTTAVQWTDIPAIVRAVEARAESARPIRIEDATASYLIVERSTSPADDGRVEISIYLDGPRRSGRAELTSSGELLSLDVS
jgi:hypothetical protein